MPRRNLPPYVQVLRRNQRVAGFRGWATTGDKRVFGPTRRTADEAHADAIEMRKKAAASQSWGGTFGVRADEWLASIAVRVTSDTIDFYKGKLALVQQTIPKTMPVERIAAVVLREFVREAGKTASARTIQHCRRTLNGLFRWMVRRGIVATNPVPDVDWPSPEETQPDHFNERELASLLARVDDPFAHALAVVIAHTGLRRAEVARLRVADVDAGARLLWVHGKTRAQAQAFAPDADAAVAVLLSLAKGREFVIQGSTEGARRAVVAETFRAWQKKLGEPRWHPHALRHSLVTILLRNGVPFATVQRTARHSSYVTTQRYAHLVAEDVRAGLTRLRIVPKDEKAQHG